MINKNLSFSKNDFNKIQKITINDQDVFLVSGVRDKNDILALNIGDKEYEIIDAKASDLILEMINAGQKIHSLLEKEVNIDKSIKCEDIFHYMFNVLLWNV